MGGRDKLLETVQGQPLLADRAVAALGLGGAVIVVLRPADAARKAALSGLPLQIVEVGGPAIGLGHSIAAGAAAADRRTPLMILPADMPDLSAADLDKVARAHAAQPERIARGCSETGAPGHPVVFPARCLPQLDSLSGDEGARSLLAGEDVLQVPLPGQRAVTDLDTPEAWAAWRARSAD